MPHLTSQQESQTTTHYVAVLIRQARILGLDVDHILSDTGIPPELSEVEDRWIDNTCVTANATITRPVMVPLAEIEENAWNGLMNTKMHQGS